MRLKSFLPAAALLSAGLILSVSASASPITGSFSLTSFGGTYVGGDATAATATGLDFGAVFSSMGNGYGTNGTALVGNSMGSFAGLDGVYASMADVSLAAFANPYTMNPFISFGSNSPIMVSFSNAAYTRSSLGTSVTIAGIATYTDGIAADASTGTFSLSANSQGGSASNTQFTFTGNDSTSPVAVTPEPSSLALLGTGMIAIAGLVRRRLA